MPRVYDPVDNLLTGIFAKPGILQPDPSPRATGRCPICKYHVVLPCQVCAEQPPINTIDTLAQLSIATGTGDREKRQEILDLAVAWVREHPAQTLNSTVIDMSGRFPFHRQYVYNVWGNISDLNRQAREIVFQQQEGAHAAQH